MTEPTRDPLDQAIDRVAARLVSVDHDATMVDRIVGRLPERSGVGGWLRVLAPQAALATAIVVATLVWTMSDRQPVDRDPAGAPAVAAAVPASEAPVAIAPISAVEAPARPTRVAARLTPPVAALPADHERSLAPVEAPIPLEIVSLASPSLPEEAFVVLLPIVLTELPLSGEAISPH
jgi:hypothetical protein